MLSSSSRNCTSDRIPATRDVVLAHDEYAGLAQHHERLFADFAPLVRRLIRQFGSDDPEMRKDLAGEIYYRFSVLVDAYDPSRGVPLRPYLVRQMTASTYTYVRQQWRTKRREASLDSGMAAGGAPGHGFARTSSGSRIPFSSSVVSPNPEFSAVSDPTASWDDEIVKKQILQFLPDLIRNLPNRQRLVVTWRYYEERSFEEIASQLEVKVATARSLLRHGIASLRKELVERERFASDEIGPLG